MVQKFWRYLFVLTWSTNMTDGRTATAWRHRPRLCITSCGRNLFSLFFVVWVWGVARCCLPRSPGQPQHLKHQNRIWWYDDDVAVSWAGDHDRLEGTETDVCSQVLASRRLLVRPSSRAGYQLGAAGRPLCRCECLRLSQDTFWVWSSSGRVSDS